MNNFIFNISKQNQYGISIFSVIGVALICFFIHDLIDYKIVAFILLITVSILAILLEIIPTLLAAFLSAIIWNFFFIKPYYTFHIENTDDVLLFLMYFIIALVNAVLTYKIRKFQQLANEKEAKLKSIKLYNTLLDSLSHELKTPIATIIGATDNLQNNNSKLSINQQEKLISEVSIASIRLNKQVENLLNMSRLESGIIKAKKDWVEVSEVIYKVVKELKVKALQHNIRINIEENLPLFCLDFGLLEQAIYNLVNNALIYTPENSTIGIQAQLVEEKLSLLISDNGKGFPEDEIDFVFDKFYRLKNSKPGGSGLGLSIVKGFIEAQNGTITLKNDTLNGAIFTILIATEFSHLNTIKND